MTNKEQVKVYLPPELHELMNADSRPNSEIAEAALWSEFGGERKAPLERRIEEKENRINVIKNERNERNRELEEKREELESLRSKLERLESEQVKQERAKQSALDERLDSMNDLNMTLPADHPSVKEIARDHFAGDVEQAWQALKQRNEERGQIVSPTQFGVES